MKHGKKLLSLFLSVVMVLGLLPTSALAAGNVIEHLNTEPPTGQVTWSGGSVISSKDSEDNTYLGQLYIGKANTDTVITIDGTVTLTATPFPYGNVTIQGGENGGTIIFDTTGYTYKSDANFGQGLFALTSMQSLTLKDITVKYTQMAGPAALFFLPTNGDVTLDNVTLTNLPYEYLIGWNNVSNGKIKLKNKLTITDSQTTQAHVNLGSAFSNFVLENYSSESTTLKLRIVESTFNKKGDPFLIATGATKANERNFEFYTRTYDSDNKSYGPLVKKSTMYAEGNIYLGSGNTQPTRTKWEIDLGAQPTVSNATFSGGAFRQIVSKGTAIEDIVLTPTEGKTFAGVDLSAMNTTLGSANLSATVDSEGKLKITGTPTASMFLSSLSFPEPVSASKTVTLPALVNTGLTLAANSGSLEQTVTGTSAITNIVLTADDSHILPNDYAATLNGSPNGLLYGTGLTATQNGQTITISGTPTAAVDKGGASWPETTAAEAVITDGSGTVVSKHTSLGAALTAATSGQTVEIKKDTVTAVDNATLKNGVTLKDKTGNTYKAADGNATVSVDATGKVTLTGGKLEVSEDGKVQVNGKTIESGTPKGTFTVSTTDVTVSAGKSVTTGNGLTFTAGAANSTFPLDGSDLSGNAAGDAITVSGSATDEKTIQVGTKTVGDTTSDVKVTVPTENNGDVTVTKGGDNGAMATVKVEKAGDKFTVGDKTYTAGTDGATFTIDANGNVKLTSGGLSLSDGESTTGTVSDKTIENPASSGGDSVTVENKTTHDEVTVPQKGTGDGAVAGSVKIDGKTYTNNSTTADLKLKVTADGKVAVSGGALGLEDGSSIVGGVSGATIANPAGSGGDRITVISNGTKDSVTIPDGVGNKVSITKGDKTEEYTNGGPTQLVIDVTADGATLANGSVALSKDQGIGVYGNTITNNNEAPLKIQILTSGSDATLTLEEGQSFTDKDGNTYTAKENNTQFDVDKATGKIRLLSGSAEVTPAAGETAEVQVAKTGDDFYSVSGSEKFTVTVGSGSAAATVTLPAGKSATSGNLTFTAGADVGTNGSTFPLDGSVLNNNGDSLTVAGAETNDVTVKVGTTGESATDINVTIPGGNSGATTVTKGQPTIVTIGENGDKFKVNGTEYPSSTAKAGEEYAIDMANGTVTKVEAKLWNADNSLANYGGLSDMLTRATSGQTVEMITAPEPAISSKEVRSGVKITDLDGDGYTVMDTNATVSVDTNGKITLENGKLKSSMDGEIKTGAYTVTGTDIEDFFTVSADSAANLYQVTIGNKDGNVSNGKGLTFTAGAANSTFPLDGSKLNNNGDSVTVSKDKSDAQTVALGSESGAPSVTIPASNTGDTTVTKGQPAGFVGSVTLTKSGDTFTVGDKTYKFDDGGTAESSATFGIRADGNVAMLDGSTVLPASGGEMEVKADGWTSGVRVSTPSGNSTPVLVTANSPDSAAVVKSGDSVTIGGKTYTAKEDDTIFNFDQTGKVTLALGKAELDKDESILGGVGKLEIKNTSADNATKVTVESVVSDPAKDIVTVPVGGKVTIGGKEYTNSGSDEMKLEIDAQGNVTLADGKADFGKDTSLNLNGAEIKNTGNSALTMTDNGDGTGKLDVKQNGSFTVGTGTVKDPSADMSFTINGDGTLTATLPENGSVTINGVKYTGGASGATLKLDKDGKLAISGTYTANVPGQTTHEVSGKVMQDSSGVPDATVTLTQGGKEAVKLATVTTGSDGSYKFPAVPAGTYNVVVVTPAGKTMTKLVTVANGDVNMGDLVLPTASVSSVVDVKPTSPVGAMVGGLDTVASSNAASSSNVTITLEVDQAADNDAIAALAGGKTLMSMDFTINKKVGSDISQITDTGATVLEVILTFDTTNKTNITVFRKHNGTAAALEKLTERPTDSAAYRDGTYYVGNGFVVVYTSKFSPYAIGYDVVSYSGGSGSSSASTSVNVGKTTNGSVSVSPKSTRKGNTVTVTVKPDAGFKLGSLTVTDKNGNALTVKKLSDTQYTFIAPAGKVDVKAVFVKAGVGYADCAKDSTCPVAAFTDTLSSAWYHDGVHYCVDNGLMSGYSNGTFAPDRATTRAQLVVMLWRLNGCPVVDSALDFTDVPADAWCAEAIRWAKATGVSGGYGNGTFGPDNTMTREQMVTFLYRYAQNMNYDVSVGESTNILSFADAFSVSEYAIPAMQWACGSGMMAGKRDTNGDMILMPQGTTTRAQMATMLMRFCAEIAK